MSGNFYFQLVLRISLAIPMVYHGFWNLLDVSNDWWVQQFAHWSILKYPVGSLEIFSAIALFYSQLRTISAIVIATLMVGAVFYHLPMGYSFKNNGYETPLTYFLIALAIFLEGLEIEKEKSSRS